MYYQKLLPLNITALCKKGQYVKDKVCTVCGVDTYQPNLHPAAGVTCTECPARNGVETGTRDTGAHSEDACERE